jgi:hypothetical protein
MQIEMQNCTITRVNSRVLQVHCPDGMMYAVSSWKEAMELIEMYHQEPDDDDEEEDEQETASFIISDEQLGYVLEGLDRLSEGFTQVDGKERKAAVFLFTREANDNLSIHCIGNLDKEWLHEMLRGWLHRETQ